MGRPEEPATASIRFIWPIACWRIGSETVHPARNIRQRPNMARRPEKITRAYPSNYEEPRCGKNRTDARKDDAGNPDGVVEES